MGDLPTSYNTFTSEELAALPRRRTKTYLAVFVAGGSLLSALGTWSRSGLSLAKAAAALEAEAAALEGLPARASAAAGAAESPGASERARIVHADAAVGLACPAYDDDASYDAKCPAIDAKSWCAASVTSAGTPFAALCPTACDDEDAAWAMPCAWMAVKSLPAACAGAFTPSLEGLASANAAATGDEPNPLTLGGDARLYGCDEHAVCFSCYNGNNPGATADARYCEAVAAYYGGFGVPFATDGDVWSLRAVAGATVSPFVPTRGDAGITEMAGEIGANAAWRAINDDWAFWCDAETLAAIDQGTFADRYLQRRG